MDKSTRMSKIKARLNHTMDLLKKAQAVLDNAERTRDERFGDAEMEQNAKEAAEGLTTSPTDPAVFTPAQCGLDCLAQEDPDSM